MDLPFILVELQIEDMIFATLTPSNLPKLNL